MIAQRDGIRVAMYAALLAAAVCLPTLVRAQSISPDTILAAPTQYDGQSVTVTGTAKTVTTRQMRNRSMTRYDLCATSCIHVIDFTGATITEGAATTATGTFRAHVERGTFSVDNTLLVGTPPMRRGMGSPGGPGGATPPTPASTASP